MIHLPVYFQITVIAENKSQRIVDKMFEKEYSIVGKRQRRLWVPALSVSALFMKCFGT